MVQVIDNFARNHKLGNVFEARVGDGRLLVCTIDLFEHLEQRPAARQFLREPVRLCGVGAVSAVWNVGGDDVG